MKDYREFIMFGTNAVRRYYAKNFGSDLKAHDVFLVWHCKALQNFKGIFAAYVSDNLLFEVTWNGDNQEGYIDCYDKQSNERLTQDDLSRFFEVC